MPILGSQGVTVVMTTRLNGRNGHNVLSYHPLDDEVIHTPLEIALAWDAAMTEAWQDAINQNCRLVRLTVSTTSSETIPPYPPVSHTIGAAGSQTGESLTAFDAYSLVKIPDTPNREPAEGQPPRMGYIRLQGVGEAQQAQGDINSTQLSLLNALADELRQFLVGSDQYQMHYAYTPEPNGSPNGVVPVASIVAGTLVTSQVSRKKLS